MSRELLDALDALARGSADPSLGRELARARQLAARETHQRAELEAQVARYQTVLARALELTSTTGLGPVAGKLIDGMLEVAGANRGFIGLAQGESWDLLVARNMTRDDVPDAKSQVSTSIISEVLRTGQPMISEDARHEEKLGGARSVFALRLRSVACLPLTREGHTIGFVYLDDARSRGLFDEAALTAVRAWLPLAAESVYRAMQKEGGDSGPLGVPTRSKALHLELERLARVAGFDASILLTGETGTGKSMLARKVHDASPRASRPFVHLNCGAVPETLLEAELFGSEAGAYTGSKGQRQGRFEAAEGGTLFLDELDTMPLGCQVKLLVALQERTITRLGSNTPIPVNVRLIAAMSSLPPKAIADGRLREDLYYRLAVIETRLPALRERPEDIPLIARNVLEQTAARYGMPSLRLSDQALAQLLAHSWPGNVRELQNAMDRAALFSLNGEIDEVRVGGSAPAAPATRQPSGLMEALEHAAALYVAQVEKNPKLAGLDRVDGFRGAVVAEAIRRFGGRDEAFLALGEGSLVEGRNHHRVIKRELARLAELQSCLDD